LHNAFRWNAGQPYAFYATHNMFRWNREADFCFHSATVIKAPNYTNAAVTPLANSRRVNHFAAGVLFRLRHLFAGLRSLARRSTTAFGILRLCIFKSGLLYVVCYANIGKEELRR
jgi:hypothetical protein